MGLYSTGALNLASYGVGTFLATPAYALGVDAFGDVVEFAVPSGTTILLETNGVANGDQTVLNLKEGPGVQISDDGVGGVTITSTQLTNIYATFDVGIVLSISITIDIDNIGTYSSASFTGGMTSATYTVNATPDTLPFTLVIGDVLVITPNAAGQIKLSGIV
jgi:hypothetical protein